MKKQNRTLSARFGALVLALAMLLALTACGQRAERKQDTDPTVTNEPEMNRDGVPSATLQGIYDELTADYSAYSEAKSYYAQNLPEVQLGESESNGNSGYDSAEVADSMLSGTWQDELSQRANLDVVMYSDGHYEMTVMWGSSASETAVWEFSGYFNPGADDHATITYDDGYYSVRTYDASGNETITEEVTTQGSITLQDDGKLRWTDSQVTANGYSDGCLFVQVG